MKNNIGVRPYVENDKAFIYATWLRSYKHSSEFAKRIQNSIFFDWHHRILDTILNRPTCLTFIAHPIESPEVILGYVTTELRGPEKVVHFCFIKREFRKLGVAKKLFETAGLDSGNFSFSHWTYAVNDIISKFENSPKYNPYLL